MKNATRRYDRRNKCLHCGGKHASEDHHLSIAIPPESPIPTRPPPRQRNPTPGPSTQKQGHPRTTNTTRTRRPRQPKEKKRNKRHAPSQCNRCINGRRCDDADYDDGYDDPYGGDDAAYHNLAT